MSSIKIGILGIADTGKTTLLANLTGKRKNEYNLERKIQGSLKVTFESFFVNQKGEKCNRGEPNTKVITLLDTPGHKGLLPLVSQIGSFIDLFFILITPGLPISGQLTHINLALSYKKKIVFLQNRIDLFSTEILVENYNDLVAHLKEKYNIENITVIRISALQKIGFEEILKEAFNHTPDEIIREKNESVAYVLKSFNDNKNGLKLEQIKGGLLGVIYYGRKIKKENLNYLYVNFLEGGDQVYEVKILEIKDESEEFQDYFLNETIYTIRADIDRAYTSQDKLLGSYLKSSRKNERYQKAYLTLGNHLSENCLVLLNIKNISVKGKTTLSEKQNTIKVQFLEPINLRESMSEVRLFVKQGLAWKLIGIYDGLFEA